MRLEVIELTAFTEISNVRPRIFTDALEVRPELLALTAIFAWVGHAARLTVLNNLGQVHRHVTVDIQNFTVHYQTSEATD